MLLVARELNARRPDGIFAFSQGASAAAILLAATRPSTSGSAETEAMVTGLGLGEVHVQRFAVLVGPFLANDPRWAQVSAAPRQPLCRHARSRLASWDSRLMPE